MNTPIVLDLYDENNEKVKTCTRTFVPWKMLKKAVALNKAIGQKDANSFEESDMDALTNYIMELFSGQGLTIALLDEGADVQDMMNVIKSVMSYARGIMDPTLPSQLKKKLLKTGKHLKKIITGWSILNVRSWICFTGICARSMRPI